MKKLKIETKSDNNFIGAWQSESLDLMDQIIEFFESNSDLAELGMSGHDRQDKEYKDTSDITIFPNDLEKDGYNIFKEYISELDLFHKDYRKQWEFFGKNIENIYSGPFNIQKYEIGGHVNKWHTERSHISNSHRILAWITYLNDVEVGGETEFLYYNKKIKPEKGKTLIWPAEWTHAHRGTVTPSIKYVITGWFHLPNES
ncbi:2OG-Fe(II) oxygenase [Hyphomicrobiales bacterium]|nr:2OG-Fe(II) oxygenase [Hyphomicrobiales bacterium]